MTKRNINLVLIISLLLHLGCEKITFLPIQGEIEGRITDNNGQAVAGASVSATFEAPTEFGRGEQQTKSTTTDADGHYQLTGLWDEILLRVDHPGLEPVSTGVKLKVKEQSSREDLTMNGSPSIQDVTFDKTVLSVSSDLPDTIFFSIEVEDLYNSQPGSYRGNLLLEDNTRKTRLITAVTVEEQGLDRVLLTGKITGEDLVPGTYQPLVETIDPDENSHRVIVNQTIRIE